VCAVLATLCGGTRASARDEPAIARPSTAKVIVAGDDNEAAIIDASVVEQLERLGVRAETSRSGSVRPDEVVAAEEGEAGMVARVWIDSTSPSETILYVADRSGSRVLIRRFPRAGRVEIAREATMAALQTAVDALLHGGQIGVSREEARVELGVPAPAPEAPATSVGEAERPRPSPDRVKLAAPAGRPPREEIALGLGVAYEIGGYANNAIEHGPVVALSLERPFDRRVFGVTLSGQYRFPMQAASGPVTLRVESGALRLAAVAQVIRSPLDLRATLGGGVDVVRADPGLVHVVDATLTPVSRVDPVMRAGVLGRVPLMIANRPVLELELAVDVAPFVRSFAVARGETQTLLLAPWTVRPLLLLGIAVP